MKMVQPNELVESKLYMLGCDTDPLRKKGEPYTKYDHAIYLGKNEDAHVFYIVNLKEIEHHSFIKDYKYDFIFEP